jgi:hypothetical protein
MKQDGIACKNQLVLWEVLFNSIFFVFLFYFFSDKEGFYGEPEIFKKETNAQHCCNDHLQNVTAASGIDV